MIIHIVEIEPSRLAIGLGLGLFAAMFTPPFMPALLDLETRVLGASSVVGAMVLGAAIPTAIATGVGRMLVRARRAAWQPRAMAETGVPPERIGWVA